MKENRLIAPCLVILTVIAVAMVLKFASNVFLPLVLAWLVSYVISPIFAFFDRQNYPKALTAALATIVLVILFLLASALVSNYMSDITSAAPKYAANLSAIFKDISQHFNLNLSMWSSVNWGERFQKGVMILMAMTLDFSTSAISMLFFLVFILSGRRIFSKKVQKASFGGNADQLNEVLVAINRQIGQYLRLMTLISAMTGVGVWLSLKLLGVDFAAAWGCLAFVLNYIPNVGSIIASIPPILLAFIQFYPSPTVPFLAALAILFVEMAFGNVIGPKLMGDSLDLSPMVILFFLLLWGWIWGAAGALLSVPIAVIVKIICDNVGYLKPIGVLLGSGK